MKKIILLGIIPLIILGSGYYYIRYVLLKTKDFAADGSKARSMLDLRPSIIAKLQQLVKDGSGGLYVLSIDKLDPDVLSSKLDVLEGTISIDSTVMLQLDKLQKLPDDIFHIKFHSLHIDGIGINDLLQKKNIDITAVNLDDPEINIYHEARSYNKEEQQQNDSLTLYRRLMGQMDKIAIGAIHIEHGTLLLHDVKQHNRITRFSDISIGMKDVLIDSSTQFDADRFLFARQAVLETHNYEFPTPDSMYFVKLGTIRLAGEKHSITVLNAALIPRGNRQQFEKKLTGRDAMYTVNFPEITLSDVDWWNLVNKEKIIAKKTVINGGTVSVFFDESVPVGPPQPKNHFPHQLVMTIPVPVLVDELAFNHLKVIFEEYKPDTRSSGASTYNNITGDARHITNIPAEIKRSRYTVLSASCLFMNKVPLTANFKFDLLKQRTGQFTTDVRMGMLDKELINPIAGPLGQFNVKRGEMQEATVHMEGDNFNLHATAAIHYTNLHITPLQTDSANDGLKKSHVKSFFANTLFIKNDNPNNGKLRQPEYDYGRDNVDNFVTFIWHTIMAGLLKSVGIPLKLGMKE